MLNGVWITWENQRRNKGVSSGLGLRLYEIISSKKGIIRYFISIYKTVVLIVKKRPDVVVVQNPSIVLALLMVLKRPFFQYFLAVDSHNAGIFPLEGESKLLNKISAYVQRKADLTIVTNVGLKTIVENNKGKAYVLPDRIPDIEKVGSFTFERGKRLVFICTFSEDEPYDEVFDAARGLPEDFVIYVTGKYQGKVDPCDVPKNIKLLGFVPDEVYWGLLAGSDIVIDLTTRENCLVCGAYEGLALNKPLILSDTEATKFLFNKGCIYVDSNSDAIRLGILECVEKHGQLLNEVEKLKYEMTKEWDLDIANLKMLLA